MRTLVGSGAVQSAWGDDVVDGHYGGHPGLVYRQRPHTFAELFAGVERWEQRTFLVQGDRRISFGEFFAAVADGTGAAGSRWRSRPATG